MTYQSKTMVSRNLYHVFLASLCGLIVWIAFSVYQILTVPAEVIVESKVLEPISIGLDEEVLEALMKRQLVSTDISILPEPAKLEIEKMVEVIETASPSGGVNVE